MRKIGSSIDDTIAEEHLKIYKSVNFGATRATTSWIFLRKSVIQELFNYFDESELNHLVEIQRGLPYNAAYAVMVESFMLRLKQNPKDDALALKIKSLDSSQAMILTDWIDCYLRAEKKNPERLEEMKKELIA